MKRTLIFCLLLLNLAVKAQETNYQPIEVLTLGVFHFNFPNLDVEKTEESDKIDVLQDKYQAEIELIVKKLAEFKPTIIVVEQRVKYQTRIDSLYNLYIQNKYISGRPEHEQIGFRLAKKMKLDKLHCVDEWGDFDADIEKLLSRKDTLEYSKFDAFFYNNPDRDKVFHLNHVFKTKGILEELKQLNNPDNISKSLGFYLTGMFKYESQEDDFLGVKFETGRWFSRNLKIFRNIQRIETKPSDKILVIYGAGHMNLLNIFFESSPEYKLVKANDYLK